MWTFCCCCCYCWNTCHCCYSGNYSVIFVIPPLVGIVDAPTAVDIFVNVDIAVVVVVVRVHAAAVDIVGPDEFDAIADVVVIVMHYANIFASVEVTGVDVDLDDLSYCYC